MSVILCDLAPHCFHCKNIIKQEIIFNSITAASWNKLMAMRDTWRSSFYSCPWLCHCIRGFAVLLPWYAHTLSLTHTHTGKEERLLWALACVSVCRPGEAGWGFVVSLCWCAGVNLGCGLNTQGMFWEDLQPSAVAFHILLHSCGSAATNTTIDPLSRSHTLLPLAFLFFS